MSDFRIDIDYNDDAVQAGFARLIDAGEDLEPLFRDIGEYLVPVHEERWEQGLDPDGNAWEPLKPRTLKRKSTTKILLEEGDLLRGLIYEADSDSLEFGISDHKAGWHHFGTKRKGKDGKGSGAELIPARPLVGISDDDEAEVLLLMQDFISGAWNPA